MAKKGRIFLLLVVITCITAAFASTLFLSGDRPADVAENTGSARPLKLYWFIPDGLRADPSLFTVFQWAKEGLLPNLKKMMENGAYGYSLPVFPGHTPTNFATLLTGATPRVHGIADGPMHIAGYPLKMVSKGGFSSVAKKVPPIWYTLEERGFIPTLLSVPGSTPPELDLGITIRGRWGGWGADFPAIIFHSAKDQSLQNSQGFRNRVFQFGSELTRFVSAYAPHGWDLELPESFSPAREVALNNWGVTVYACLVDSTDDGVENYDLVVFSLDKINELTRLSEGQWSGWLPVTLAWEMKNDYNIYTPKRMAWERDLSVITVDSAVAINIIKLGEADFFRIRFFYDNLNPYMVKPSYFEAGMQQELGPMTDFPDNYPPQLIYYPEDKDAFLAESQRSLAWHKAAVHHLVKNSGSDVIIHDIYTPNQMLTSRWWLGHLDPQSRHFRDTDEAERQGLWEDVKAMYRGIDAILGEILAAADENTVVVFSSDHGIVPLDQEVRLNNLFARRGLLQFQVNPETGLYEIDWQKTKAIFLKMNHIFLNPDGLGGIYRRASGPEYEKLRQEVTDMLLELKDENGINPVARIVKWEKAEIELDLPADRIGDLVIANKPTYGWEEDVSADLQVFHPSLKGGYKQAIIPEESAAMLTPFAIIGPGVRKNYKMQQPIHHVDQYPTIMALLGQTIPEFVEGRPLTEIFQEEQ